MKVFIADDSTLLLQRLISVITSIDGVKFVGEAENAPGAIETIRELEPDTIVLDIRLPRAGGSGPDVLQSIEGTNPEIRVIMFTNFPIAQYRRRCLEEGADHFFSKATEFEELLRVLREWAQDMPVWQPRSSMRNAL